MNTNDMRVRAAQLSNHALLAQVRDPAQRERDATVAMIVHLAELDERRLYLAEGYSSLFKYCTDVLHLAEHATYNRIEAARAMRRFSVLLECLAAGWVNLSAVRLLAPHLTPENHREVLALARHKSKRETEELVARLRPQPPVPNAVRKLPARTQAPSTAALPVGAQDATVTLRCDETSGTLLAVPPVPIARRAVHDVVPDAGGGPSTVDNIQLRCRAHNGYEAERHFGQLGTAVVREETTAYAPGVWGGQRCSALGHRPKQLVPGEFQKATTGRMAMAKFREDVQCRTDPHVSSYSHVSLTMVGM